MGDWNRSEVIGAASLMINMLLTLIAGLFSFYQWKEKKTQEYAKEICDEAVGCRTKGEFLSKAVELSKDARYRLYKKSFIEAYRIWLREGSQNDPLPASPNWFIKSLEEEKKKG